MFPGADGTALRSHESTCLSPGFGAKEGQAAFRNSPDFPRNRENEVSGIPYLSRSPLMSTSKPISSSQRYISARSCPNASSAFSSGIHSYRIARFVVQESSSTASLIFLSSPARSISSPANRSGSRSASDANPPMSSTQIIWRFVSGESGRASNPSSSEDRIHGETKFSMKETGRRIVYGRPLSRIYSSTSNLLSKWGIAVSSSAPHTDEYTRWGTPSSRHAYAIALPSPTSLP